jgi:mannose-6-phosphate isomerase-like protein (cupin superfamily)
MAAVLSRNISDIKKITILSGCKTSLQYHNKKTETIYIASGNAKYYYADLNGDIRSKDVESGFFVYIKPKEIHRFWQ